MRWISYVLAVLALLSAPAAAQDRAESIFRDARHYTVRIRTQIVTPFVEDVRGSFHGAGFLVDAERRWVVTNAHVVGQSPSSVQVAFAEGIFRPARKLYVDSFTDVAILEVAAAARRRPGAVIHCDAVPQVGEGVGVFGHPLGYLFTGTRGIVSGKSGREIVDLIQTDATIDHGNSGGPVIALRDGRIIGIATSGHDLSKTDRMNFATPMKDVCRILDLLRRGVAPEPPLLEFALLIDEKDTHTLRVGRSFDESRWPFQPGDRIVSVGRDGEQVRTPHELVTAMRGRTGAVPIVVMRDGRETVVQARPRFRPAVVARRGVTIDGALIAPQAIEDSTALREPARLMVHSVEEGSPAHALGLGPSDVIETLDGRRFEDLDSLLEHLAGRQKGSPLRIVVRRLSQSASRWFDHHVRDLPGEEHKVIGPESELSAGRPGDER